MLSPDDIREACRKKYPAFLRALVAGETFFPLEIRFGRPSTTAAWSTLQSEITALAAAQPALGYRIDWSDTNTRQWGRQRLPERVWLENEADYLALIGKDAETRRFRRNVELTRRHCPELEGWLVPHVGRIVDNDADWPDVLQVCRHLIDHPRPNLYLRELPVPVGTKFIEERRPLFRSLLDFVLPPGAIARDADHFETRFGFRFDEAMIRLRALDPALAEKLRLPASDLALPFSQLRELSWRGLTVLVVENKMTFLTLPAFPGSIGIWGGGNAAELLSDIPWLGTCRIHYWGDLDVHGFHILSRLRGAWPETRSVMMDEITLAHFAAYHVPAARSNHETVAHLTPAEHTAYLKVQAARILLEQEKIPHAFAMARLTAALATPAPASHE